MAMVDVFVVADTFQYSRQSFHNRTPIRTPHGRHWLSIPVLGGQHGRAISETRVASRTDRWRKTHWRTLEFNYRSTPYFEFLEVEARAVLDRQSDCLAEYTLASVLCIQHLLELRTKVVSASEMRGAPNTLADVAASLEGGVVVALEDTADHDYAQAQHLEIVRPKLPEYRQNFPGHEGGLSSLDVLFNLGPAATRRIIGLR